MKTADPQIRVKKLVADCHANGSSSLWIDKPFFDAVCRAYAVDPGNVRLRGIELNGVEIKPLEVMPRLDSAEAKAALAL